MRYSITGFALCILLAGCAGEQGQGPIEVTPLTGWGVYPPQAFIKVVDAPPEGTYVPIARLVVSSSAGLDRAQALTAMEQKARDLGANGLILTEETKLPTSNLTFNPSGGSYSLSPPRSGARFGSEAIHLTSSDTQN